MTTTNNLIIREIQPEDNTQVTTIVRSVLEEFNVPKTGTAYADAALDDMYETYNVPRASYFVIMDNGKIIGGGGVAQLQNYDGNVCELQKMYFLEDARGKGLGRTMVELCLAKAREYGYEKCYLETMTQMTTAQELYKKFGFEYIDGPMGNTGHYLCPVWMLKTL